MHSAQGKSLPDEGQGSRARSSVWAFWSSRGASVKRYSKRQNTGMGMARAGTLYDCVRTAVPIGGGGPAGRRAEAPPRCARICSTMAGCEMVASRRSRSPQRGQASTCSPKARWRIGRTNAISAWAAGVCIFRWDINIRESTVPGIVRAGGIGFVLNEAILGLEWARVSLILLVILGVVALSEVGSAWIRRRLA